MKRLLKNKKGSMALPLLAFTVVLLGYSAGSSMALNQLYSDTINRVRFQNRAIDTFHEIEELKIFYVNLIMVAAEDTLEGKCPLQIHVEEEDLKSRLKSNMALWITHYGSFKENHLPRLEDIDVEVQLTGDVFKQSNEESSSGVITLILSDIPGEEFYMHKLEGEIKASITDTDNCGDGHYSYIEVFAYNFAGDTVCHKEIWSATTNHYYGAPFSFDCYGFVHSVKLQVYGDDCPNEDPKYEAKSFEIDSDTYSLGSVEMNLTPRIPLVVENRNVKVSSPSGFTKNIYAEDVSPDLRARLSLLHGGEDKTLFSGEEEVKIEAKYDNIGCVNVDLDDFYIFAAFSGKLIGGITQSYLDNLETLTDEESSFEYYVYTDKYTVAFGIIMYPYDCVARTAQQEDPDDDDSDYVGDGYETYDDCRETLFSTSGTWYDPDVITGSYQQLLVGDDPKDTHLYWTIPEPGTDGARYLLSARIDVDNKIGELNKGNNRHSRCLIVECTENMGYSYTSVEDAIHLSWDESPLVFKPYSDDKDDPAYTVFFKEAGETDWEESDTQETSKSYSDLDPGVEYEFKVDAMPCGVVGCTTGEFSTATKCDINLEAPIGDITTDSIKLQWDDCDAANDGYWVFIFDSDNDYCTDLWCRIGTTSDDDDDEFTIGSDVGLESGKEYGFKVTARRNNEDWGSDTITTATKCDLNLMTTDITDESITIEWDACSAATDNFNIYIDNDLKEIGYSDTSYSFSGLSAGTTYDIEVVPNRDGDDWGSEEIHPTTDACPINAISADNVKCTSLNLSWSDDCDAESEYYVVEYKDVNSDTDWQQAPGTPSSPQKIINLAEGTTYDFKVNAKDSDGNIIASNNIANPVTTFSNCWSCIESDCVKDADGEYTSEDGCNTDCT